MSLPNNIIVLQELESEQNVISIFAYKNTSGWISVKNFLTIAMYDKSLRTASQTKENFLSADGFKLLLLSIKNYVAYLFDAEEKDIFLGAGTGLFLSENEVLDSYFPYYLNSPNSTIYMINCGNVKMLLKHHDYLESNKVVAENYIIGVLKKLLIKPVGFFIKKDKKTEIIGFYNKLKEKNVAVSYQNLFDSYVNFIIGYELYRLFFRFLKIKDAYIVSAPTKSDMVAALKSLAIRCTEIQHSVAGKLHRGFNYNFPFDKRLPTPDQINVYNQFWKDEIVHAGYFQKEQINIVGRLKYDIVRNGIEELNYKYIVFTGQGGFFDDISLFFQEADPILKKSGIKMFYKTHPRETNEEITSFAHSIQDLQNCSVYAGDFTTEELIKHSFAHISVFSSCHFDAVHYKNKTYVFDVMNDNIMNYYSKTYPDIYIKVKTMKELLDHETLI